MSVQRPNEHVLGVQRDDGATRRSRSRAAGKGNAVAGRYGGYAAAAVQLRGSTGAVDVAAGPTTAAVQQHAVEGVSGARDQLPHANVIQQSFGKHDISSIESVVGGPAAAACDAIGATAYMTNGRAGFKSAPDLHTSAHEAAHFVQQAGGVQLKGGVGQVGDQYEGHADAVADAVVAGKSAEGLLDHFAGNVGSQPTVQLKATAKDSARASVSHSGRAIRSGKAAIENDKWGVSIARALADLQAIKPRLSPADQGRVASLEKQMNIAVLRQRLAKTYARGASVDDSGRRNVYGESKTKLRGSAYLGRRLGGWRHSRWMAWAGGKGAHAIVLRKAVDAGFQAFSYEHGVGDNIKRYFASMTSDYDANLGGRDIAGSRQLTLKHALEFYAFRQPKNPGFLISKYAHLLGPDASAYPVAVEPGGTEKVYSFSELPGDYNGQSTLFGGMSTNALRATVVTLLADKKLPKGLADSYRQGTQVDLRSPKTKSITRRATFKPHKRKGRSVEAFEYSSSRLTGALQQFIVSTLQKDREVSFDRNNSYHIRIIAEADSSGTRSGNETLSTRRALAARRYMLGLDHTVYGGVTRARKLQPSQITAVGAGDGRARRADRGKPRNRRGRPDPKFRTLMIEVTFNKRVPTR